MTATTSALVFHDWPLMGGTLLPGRHRRRRPRKSCIATSPAVVGAIVLAIAVAAWRTQREHPTLVRLAVSAAVLYAIQIVVGGLQILTTLAGWAQALHLALGTIIWSMLVGLAIASYYTARVTAERVPASGPASTPTAAPTARPTHAAARPSGPISP